jgi:aminoglycoside 3-N-acetyltransferase
VKTYSIQDIEGALTSTGIKKGDTLFIHSNIGFFGVLANAHNKDDYCRAFLHALTNCIGDTGNLCFPTFTYSFCKGEPFNPNTSVSEMGMLPEFARVNGAIRSHDANFSVSVIGKDAAELTKNAPEHSFGKDSFWDRFLNIGGKICNLNFDAGSTFLHHIEKKLNVPYRFDKPFYGKLIANNDSQDRCFIHFARHLDKPEWGTSMTKFDAFADGEHILSKAKLNRGVIITSTANDVMNTVMREIAKNPYFLTVKGYK